jgi:hypothetical protein
MSSVDNDTKLTKLLKPMDLPWNRKDDFTPHKLRWLRKNMCKRNQAHENYTEAIRLIDEMLG